MALFRSNGREGFLNVIRCDEESYLIWKWHPQTVEAGAGKRENEIRDGSPLHIRAGEVAVFVYHQEDETFQDYIEGPYDGVLKTKNIPIIAGIIGKLFNDNSPFQAEVYFINMSGIIQNKFGVPFFDVFDPRFNDYSVPIAVRGTLSYRIKDYKEFFTYYRSFQLDQDTFQEKIKDVVGRVVKSTITAAPATYNVPVIQLERNIDQINTTVEETLREDLNTEFGVSIVSVNIGDIVIDKDSDGYQKLMAVTQDVETATIKAKTAAQVKDIADMQRIEIENKEEMMRIQREEAQYQMHLQTQSQNMAAHQLNQQAAVGIAGAEALGQFGANAGSGDGSGGGGLNPTALMAGMAIGGTLGQNIAGTMNNMMSGINQPAQGAGVNPPPIIGSQYHVAVNGQAAGPYSLEQLSAMVTAGQLRKDSLVWKQGMPQWAAASTVSELSVLFPPDIPPVP